jgi:hypothetical protein
VTALTECNEVIWRVATHLAAFKMVNVEFYFYAVLCIPMFTAAYPASISITVEYVLSSIVLVVLLAQLMVSAYGQWSTFKHCFETLSVKLRCLNNYLCDWKQIAYRFD